MTRRLLGHIVFARPIVLWTNLPLDRRTALPKCIVTLTQYAYNQAHRVIALAYWLMDASPPARPGPPLRSGSARLGACEAALDSRFGLQVFADQGRLGTMRPLSSCPTG